jgi:hypothetical protein
MRVGSTRQGRRDIARSLQLIAHKRPSRLVLAGRAAVMPAPGGGVRDYLGELRALAERLGIAGQSRGSTIKPTSPICSARAM